MALTRFQNTEEISADLDRLSRDMEQLRLTYDQYFLGLERREPTKLRESVSQQIRKYAGMAIQNSRLKFRYQQTVARHNSYTAYWDRILREIEEGRYQRDVFKAKIHEQERLKKKGQTAPTAKPAPKSDAISQLFDRYIAARQQTQEPTQGLSLEKFRQTLTTQTEAIRKKTGAVRVSFQVKVEDGKVRLKAIPQKK